MISSSVAGANVSFPITVRGKVRRGTAVASVTGTYWRSRAPVRLVTDEDARGISTLQSRPQRSREPARALRSSSELSPTATNWLSDS